jgi:hypothetical protein
MPRRPHSKGRAALILRKPSCCGLGLDFCSPIVHHIQMTDPVDIPLMPGQMLARGVCRHLAGHGFVSIEEFVPERGRRVDVMAMGPKGEIWVVECKSSRTDFLTDGKWEGYLAWCDRYFWAVDQEFPTDLLPEDTGLIIADAYDAEIIRMAPEAKLAGARRNALIRKFATHAARRLQALRDPDARRRF